MMLNLDVLLQIVMQCCNEYSFKTLFFVIFWNYYSFFFTIHSVSSIEELPRVNANWSMLISRCMTWLSLRPLSGIQVLSIWVLIWANIRCISSSILLPSKIFAIKLIDSISTLIKLLPWLPFTSWVSSTLLGSNGSIVIANLTGFFHVIHNLTIIFVDRISFSWLSFNA